MCVEWQKFGLNSVPTWIVVLQLAGWSLGLDEICLVALDFIFYLLNGQKTKSAQGQRKERSNKKVEENKPALKLNFLSNSKWAGFDFEI